MSGCLIAVSKDKTCDTTKKIGGISGRLWLLNLADSTGQKLAYTESDKTISEITVQSGLAAYPVDGEKYSHNWTYGVAKPGSSNKYYSQSLNIRTIIDGDLDLQWFDGVVMATNLVAILETTDQRFIVLGQFNGLTHPENESFDSGQEPGSDVQTTVALTGEEVTSPYKYLDVGTGYADTLTYIIGLETQAA